MKQVLILTAFLLSNISFGQKMAQINYKDSCLITGGLIKMSDLKKVCKVCPPGVKKVTGFTLSYTQNPPLYLEQLYSGNRWDPKFLMKFAKPGLTFMLEEMKAIDMSGKPASVNRFIIGFK